MIGKIMPTLFSGFQQSAWRTKGGHPARALCGLYRGTGSIGLFTAQKNASDRNDQEKQIEEKVLFELHVTHHTPTMTWYSVKKIDQNKSHVSSENKHQNHRQVKARLSEPGCNQNRYGKKFRYRNAPGKQSHRPFWNGLVGQLSFENLKFHELGKRSVEIKNNQKCYNDSKHIFSFHFQLVKSFLIKTNLCCFEAADFSLME
ncbi:hypothetical protein [Dyadobacter psychrotolerans]|uniref:hypothetical protein n=1 Tax=Dyadobacter psychrotolerans TaxID=2541721 RepID=UPI001E5B7D73|nr:hypothetical protein [Dyadobacter psychrotolerans]